jgi:hypothetical protein
MKTESKKWFEILEAARTLTPPFTAADLGKAAELKDTFPSEIKTGPRAGEIGKGSSSQQIAAAWLGKFRKWGYAEVVNKVQTGAPLPTFAWKLTENGMTCEPRDGIKLKFNKIVKAAQYLRDLKGKKSEPEAWKAFLKTLDEVQSKDEEEKKT